MFAVSKCGDYTEIRNLPMSKRRVAHAAYNVVSHRWLLVQTFDLVMETPLEYVLPLVS